ncbi:MAG: undecaprenyl-diphosphate phosphatase [Gemmatimonadetes bacterium]|jgi:undecaprenyl-diphosphatase|nr:undecaprenyl-diphosphate phosphatase [Gemmatimonadota bacterium]HAC06011.1 undecaprenyl-diphosphate phosphatase [Gemmatimonadota bacterium]HIC52713.1 undecaprenyl-diphosphate phosphatase [Gemmatimonadota bacterium]HIN50098.1 undecaprenyl-diphosphate phosphatase [Gemmatimonadota bacterium]|tara:strand:- start:1717 stop:2499 length:783 start_codon:yes stop_codon:yes gene_type:complete
MTVWEAAVLGFVQGATEFLPVSSSGHLVMAQSVLGTATEGVLFEVAVHVATLLSILIVYRARIVNLTEGVLKRDHEALTYVGLLLVATVPIVVVGGLARNSVETLFDNPWVSGIGLLVTGAVLWSSRRGIARAARERPALTAAVLIGLAQVCALVPGVSRSGTTVVVALWLGVYAEEAAAFSFLMAIPAITGAAVLQIGDLGSASALGVMPLLVGSAVAAATGVLAIRTFVAMLDKRSFYLFAPYCWLVGGAFLSYLWMR